MSTPTATSASGKPKPKRWVFIFPFFSYLTLGMMVIYWDLGNTAVGARAADAGRSLIPSISNISRITPVPDSAALVLALTWLYVPAVFALLMTQAKQLARIYETQTREWPKLVKIALWVFSLLIVLYMPFHVPDGVDGRYGARYAALLGASPGFIVVWGAGTLFGMLSALMFVSLVLLGRVGRIIGGIGDFRGN